MANLKLMIKEETIHGLELAEHNHMPSKQTSLVNNKFVASTDMQVMTSIGLEAIAPNRKGDTFPDCAVDTFPDCAVKAHIIVWILTRCGRRNWVNANL